MQKVIRINLAQRSSAIKRTRKAVFAKRAEEEKQYDAWQIGATRATNKYIKDERKNRREDWIKGPLAPDRDTGLTQGKLGALSPQLLQRSELPKHAVQGPREAKWERNKWMGLKEEEMWEGEGNMGNIVVGDRVCVVKGDDGVKGKIGTVTEVNNDKGEVIVGGVNVADVEFPAYMPLSRNANRKFNTMEVPLQINNVRLVYRMTLPESGREEDVIIRSLSGRAPHIEPTYGSNRPWHTRYISGTNTKLDWPEEEIQDYPTEATDTVRKDVNDETYGYVPSVYHWPLPEGVEDELTNKYDKGRMKHDEEYLARKILEDARSKWYERRRLIADPVVEKRELKKASRDGAGMRGVKESEVWDVVSKELEEKRRVKQQMGVAGLMAADTRASAVRQDVL